MAPVLLDAEKELAATPTGRKRGPMPDWRKAKISAALKGKKVSPETRAKISAANKGRVLTAEHRAKLSASHKGKPLSAEHCAKLSAARRGRKRAPFSPEWRANISAALTGKKRGPCSAETKAKISAAKMGHSVSAKTRAKMSAATLGRKLSAETRAKMSVARMGRVMSTETRAKISVANKEAYKSPELRAEISRRQRKRFENPEFRQMMGRQVRSGITQESIAKMAATKKGRPLPHLHTPEVVQKARETWCKNGNVSAGQKRLYEILLSVGLPFVPEKTVRFADGSWSFADALVLGANLDIEYDGHQRHRKLEGQTKDHERDARMFAEHGIKTLRIGQKEVFTEHVLARIAEMVVPTVSGGFECH